MTSVSTGYQRCTLSLTGTILAVVCVHNSHAYSKYDNASHACETYTSLTRLSLLLWGERALCLRTTMFNQKAIVTDAAGSRESQHLALVGLANAESLQLKFTCDMSKPRCGIILHYTTFMILSLVLYGKYIIHYVQRR